MATLGEIYPNVEPACKDVIVEDIRMIHTFYNTHEPYSFKSPYEVRVSTEPDDSGLVAKYSDCYNMESDFNEICDAIRKYKKDGI